MPYQISTEAISEISADMLALGVFQGEAVRHLALNPTQTKMMQGEADQTLWVHEAAGFKTSAALLIGCGEAKNFSAEAFADFVKTLARAAKKSRLTSIALELPIVAGRSVAWALTQFILHFEWQLYEFNRYKTKDVKPTPTLQISFLIKQPELALEAALTQGVAMAAGVKLTRDLANRAPNDCQPKDLSMVARELEKTHPALTVNVLGEVDMLELGMGAFMSVSQGSEAEGQMIFMDFDNAPQKGSQPIVLIGKGITFDTGGYYLKGKGAMFDMRYDMCGAATIFGVIQACLLMNLPIHVIGVVAAAENMVSGNAYRPSDVIKSHAGLTIEITNTDAEGRLVLCDALSYCQKFKPSCMVDVATLTGAAITTFGRHITPLMSNNPDLTAALFKASREVEDPIWELPLDSHYKKLLKSSHGDLRNWCPSGDAGTLQGASFLAHFVGAIPWAHLDIAGTATFRDASDASGRPVALLTQFLIDHTHAKS